MEVVGAAVGAVLGSISNLLCGCVSSKMTTTLNLQSKVDVMVGEMKNLIDPITEVKNKKEAAEKAGEDILAQVATCLDDVGKLELKVKEMDEKKKPSAYFLNCKKRYRESKKVEDILEEIRRLVQVVKNIPDVVYSTTIPKAVEHIPGPSTLGYSTTIPKAVEHTPGYSTTIPKAVEHTPGPSTLGYSTTIPKAVEHTPGPSTPIPKAVEHTREPSTLGYSSTIPKAVEHTPEPSIQGQTTASKTLDETWSLLNDDRYRMIGIWGLGGVGKTTLVRTINNELKKSTSTHPFGIVIWATVSKNWEMRQVQKQIAKRLKLEVQTEESVQEIAIRLHQRLMNEEKFLLILDDVWVNIELDILGVPWPKDHNGCKIILTSRRMEVCRSMFTNFEVKIDGLNEEEAWQLFCEKAGDVVHLEEIKPFAKAIAKECCGLPLAIIVVGASMRGKIRFEQWEHALNELRKSVPPIQDIEERLYKPLKWSYDSLPDNNIRSCFLYCSLFPEDYSIEIIELVQCWLGEGLIDEQADHVHRVNTGIDLIEKLKDSCLLEKDYIEECVKMHDVVRDVAIWIASSHDDGCKSLVRSGIGLREILVEKFSKKNSLKRVSFMDNNLTMLPDCVIEQCSEASTLLLQENDLLDAVPNRFLQGFAALRVLNLRETYIQSLPRSLLQLRDLGVLNLSRCAHLEGLPSLAGLSKLQILDLSYSSIIELPDGMEKLRNLRLLDLLDTSELKDFQVGIISKLPRLEVLDMRDIAYYFEGIGAKEETETTFEELRQLHRLLFLCISFNRIPHLNFEDLSWIKNLRGFQILIDPEKHVDKKKRSTKKVKEVIIRKVDISQESIRQLCTIAESLSFHDCQGLHEKAINWDIESIYHGLKSLTFSSMKFNRSLEPNGEMASDCDPLPNLEKLNVDNLRGLESISELLGYLGLRFLSLKSIDVSGCSNMKFLLSCGGFIQTLPNLEVIMVMSCSELEKLFNYDSGQNMALDPVVPKLRKLKLNLLPKLRSLCRHQETWPCLEQVRVLRCEHLRRLPLSNQNASTIKEIKGESIWWNALEWDDDETKPSLESYFCPILP